MNLAEIDISTWLGAAALLVAIPSTSAAVISARSSRRSALAADRSADAAEAVAEIEEARYYVAHEPRWAAKVERLDRKSRLSGRCLVLNLESIEPVDHVAVRSARPDLLWFLDGQLGVEQLGDLAESVRATRSGQQAAWRVGVPDPTPGGAAQIELVSRIGSRTWSRTVAVTLPSPPPRVVIR